MMEYACGWKGCSKDTLRAAVDRQCDQLIAQQRARVGAPSPFGRALWYDSVVQPGQGGVLLGHLVPHCRVAVVWT